MAADRQGTIWVIAGPNGGGKSSIIGEMIRESGADYFDPDDRNATLRAEVKQVRLHAAPRLSAPVRGKRRARGARRSPHRRPR